MKTVQILLFFLLFYVYLWIGVDLRLIYHVGGMIANFPVFYRGWDFFLRFLWYPGGPAEYVSGFLAQFFSIGWAGALIVTIQAWLVWLCTGRIIRAGFAGRFRWVSFIPPIVMLIPYSQYSYHFGETTIALTALVFVCAYLWSVSSGRLPAPAVFAALSIILYWIAGWGYCVFTVVCVPYELFIRRRRVMSIVYLLFASAVLQVGLFLLWDTNAVDTGGYFQPYSYETGRGTMLSINILYVFLAVVLLGLLILSFLGTRPLWLSEKRVTLKKRFALIKATYNIKTSSKIAAMILPLALGAAVAYFSYNDEIRTLLELDYYASQRMWPEVLLSGEKYPKHIWANHAVNRALYHTGLLGDDMFAYPQNPDALFLSDERGGIAHWKLFDTYIDLGQMNMAAYSIIQAIEEYGERPMLLKRLALVNMARGNICTARVYLDALERTLFDAGWAMGCLDKIERDPNLSADKEIHEMRQGAADKDRPHLSINADLFTGASHNRMAFEYLMAFYLLEGDFNKFVENLPRLNDFSYTRTPRTYEEAVLYYNYTRNKNVEIPGRGINPESRRRFDGFVKVFIGKYRGDKEAAFDELARDYGDSYLFYCVYRQSGMKK